MTFTYKLARRLARLRKDSVLLLALLAACAAGEPTGTTPENPPIEASTDGPVALSPRGVILEGNQDVLFRAFESLIPGSSQVTSIEWWATGGSIAANGDYTPGSTGAFKVVGRRKGNPHNLPDTSVVIVVPPQPTLASIEIDPPFATVGGGLQQRFSAIGHRSDGTEAAIGVTWAATGGTIDAGGLYTAGYSAGTYSVIARHVTTGLTDTATVIVPPATLTSITMAPSSASLTPGQGQQFSVTGNLSDGTTSSLPVAYTATGGTVSVNGYYTAGSTVGTFRVIATAQGGKADTSSVSISASPTPPPPPPPPPPGGLWLDEDFSRYSSIGQYLSNPFGWTVTPPRWFNQSKISLGPGYGSSPHSLQYNWPGPAAPGWGGCSTDVAIESMYKMPNAQEIWIEVVHKFASTFSVNKRGVEGGTCGVGGYKFLLFWRRSGDRFDIVNGINGREWWSAHPSSENQPIGAAVCGGLGWNCRLGYGGTGTVNDQSQYLANVPPNYHDGEWHVYRVHIKLTSSSTDPSGVFEIWIDGKLVKRVTGQTWLRWDGSWSNQWAGLGLGSNSNSGTAVPTTNNWGRLRIWTSNPGW